jgi:hypothetical protein
MDRSGIALLIAAIAAPMLVLAYSYGEGASLGSGYIVESCFVTIMSFAGAFFLGLPAYLFLRAKKWTAFWIAPPVGFIVATVTWYVFIFLLGLLLAPSLSDVGVSPNRRRSAPRGIMADRSYRSSCRCPGLADRQTGSADDRRKYRKCR